MKTTRAAAVIAAALTAVLVSPAAAQAASTWTEYPLAGVTFGQGLGATTATEAPGQGSNPYVFTANSTGTTVWFRQDNDWGWLSAPTGQPVAGSVGATTSGVDDRQRPYLFARSSTKLLGANKIGVGVAWTALADLGTPSSSVTVKSGAGAVARRVPGDPGTRPYAFVLGSDNNLHTYYWNGGAFGWKSIGTPASTTLATGIGVTTVRNEDGSARPYVFVLDTLGRVWCAFMPNASDEVWRWDFLGTPPGLTVGYGVGATVAGPDNGQRAYEFVLAGDGTLWQVYWGGSAVGWVWYRNGTPPNVALAGGVGATAIKSVTNGGSNPHAFVRGDDGKLWINYWNGSGWVWQDQSTPPGRTVAKGIGVTTIRAAGDTLSLPYAYIYDQSTVPWSNKS